MKICAIIAEYNPFHNGHLHQICKIREELGADTAIIAVMSGNFTQRAEFAITDKLTRAKCAVLSGVNLVLELPFPHCMSSAEFFARGAVHIISSLGCVDYLSFGSECGDIDILCQAAEAMLTEKYNEALANNPDKSVGYARACELALKAVCPELSLEYSPNNILAIEYIKALKLISSPIIPHTVKREGVGYNDTVAVSDKLPSASSIRKLILGGESICEHVPKDCYNALYDAITLGDMPTDQARLNEAVLSYFRLNPKPSDELCDLGDGLYYRLAENSLEANDIQHLLMLTKTKKYTDAKIRRALWYAFFGVTSSDKRALPRYTQLLGMDDVGKALLHSFAKGFAISILTKPSSVGKLDGLAIRQKTLTDRVDSIFELTKPSPKSGRSGVRITPFIK